MVEKADDATHHGWGPTSVSAGVMSLASLGSLNAALVVLTIASLLALHSRRA